MVASRARDQRESSLAQDGLFVGCPGGLNKDLIGVLLPAPIFWEYSQDFRGFFRAHAKGAKGLPSGNGFMLTKGRLLRKMLGKQIGALAQDYPPITFMGRCGERHRPE
jgi:hypothetical protein